jgi:hypothetical protein
MAYNRIKHVKELAMEILNERAGSGPGFDILDAEDIEYIGQEAQCNYAGVCEILGIELPESLMPVDADEE